MAARLLKNNFIGFGGIKVDVIFSCQQSNIGAFKGCRVEGRHHKVDVICIFAELVASNYQVQIR